MKFFVLILLSASISHAYPEMIRHHYVNCNACHVSNNGGGALNAYGRTISYELLSTWGGEKEARAFYAVDPEKVGAWLSLGGDMRSLQAHQENAATKRGRYFWMQGSVDAAATIKNLTAYIQIGQVQVPTQTWREIAPKFFASYQIMDEFAVRAGRYTPIYGINIPQHQYLVRDGLGVGQNTERDAADIQWNGEKWNFAFGISKSLLNSMIRAEEEAMNAQVQYTIADSHKIGFSAWNGTAPTYNKNMFGVHGVLGWTEKFYTIAEVDQMKTTAKPTDIATDFTAQLLKFGYEFYKGAHFQVVQEYGKVSTASTTSDTQSYGAGFIWYPRPHFELESLWSKRRTFGTSSEYEDYAYLLTHFYF